MLLSLFIILNVLGAYLRYHTTGFIHKFSYPLFLFHLDKEGTIPSFFSAVKLLFSSALFAIIAAQKKKNLDKYTLHWISLALIFICLSIDEAASIHELLVHIINKRIQFSGVLYFSGVLAGIAAVVVCGASYLKFFSL